MNNNGNLSFESILERINANLDLNDPFVVKELEHYKEFAAEEIRFNEADQSLPLKNPETLELAIKMVADLISATAAEKKYHFFIDSSKANRQKLDYAISYQENAPVDFVFDIYTFRMRKKITEEDTRVFYKNIVEISPLVADLPNEELNLIRSKKMYPDQLKRIVSNFQIRDFLSDLASFILFAGVNGRNLVREVCKNVESAAKIIKRKAKYPQCIVFLSQICCELNQNDQYQPNKGKKIGFVI